MQHLTQPEWVAIAAHRLQYRWRSISPGDLSGVAADLWRDEDLRILPPSQAVDTWLTPILTSCTHAMHP